MSSLATNLIALSTMGITSLISLAVTKTIGRKKEINSNAFSTNAGLESKTKLCTPASADLNATLYENNH